MQIKDVSPFDPAVLALMEQLDQKTLEHYPPEVCLLDPPEVLARENCTMIGAYSEGTLCGIGAVKFFDDYGEIKRMFVPPQFRGHGVGRLILNQLLELTKKQGLAFARLETGAKYEAAVALYQQMGFVPRSSFGPYKENGFSFFLEKSL